MYGTQVHHNKILCKAKRKLEIEWFLKMGTIDNIKKYQKDRKLSEMIDMLNPAVDNLNIAIVKQESEHFKSSFYFTYQYL